MSRYVFLDSGVLGFATHPGSGPNECLLWMLRLLRSGIRVCVPEISDYEVRREYLLNHSKKALGKLDELNQRVHYVPIQTEAMQLAAQWWADARAAGQQAQPTAGWDALDADVVCCAQAKRHVNHGDKFIVATTDVGDLTRYVPASKWEDIDPEQEWPS